MRNKKKKTGKRGINKTVNTGFGAQFVEITII